MIVLVDVLLVLAVLTVVFSVVGAIVPAHKTTAPMSSLLSDEKFAARCTQLATPDDEPYESPPAPLPLPLRDPAFQRRARELEELDDQAWRQAWGALQVRVDKVRAPQTRRRELLAREPVTERSFEPHTHCPAGHVGWHWVWDDDQIDGQHVVHRSCWWTTCVETWAEPAYRQEQT